MHKEDHNPLNRSPYCGDPGALVSYLYNDGSADELNAIAAHVQACDLCTRDLAALGDTRDVLSAWSPPPDRARLLVVVVGCRTDPGGADFAGRTVERGAGAPSHLVAAVVAAVHAGVDAGRGGDGRVRCRSGRRHLRPRRDAGGAQRQPAAAAAVSRSELSDLEARLRAELARLATPRRAAPPVQAAAPIDDETLMRRIHTLVSESEERQRRELALRTTQVLRDIEIQRKVDIAQLQQNIGQIQGTTGAELLKQRELYNMLMNNASLRGGAR